MSQKVFLLACATSSSRPASLQARDQRAPVIGEAAVALGGRAAGGARPAVALPQRPEEPHARLGQPRDAAPRGRRRWRSSPRRPGTARPAPPRARRGCRRRVRASASSSGCALGEAGARSRAAARTGGAAIDPEAGEHQAAERVDPAAPDARQIEIEAQRVVEGRGRVLARDVVRQMGQLGQQIVVQIDDHRRRVRRRRLRADLDGKPAHAPAPVARVRACGTGS